MRSPYPRPTPSPNPNPNLNLNLNLNQNLTPTPTPSPNPYPHASQSSGNLYSSPNPYPHANQGSGNLGGASSPVVDSSKLASVDSPNAAVSSPPRVTSGGSSFSPPTSPTAEDIAPDDSLIAVFLHVYFLPLQPAPPLRLKGGEALERAVKVLDTVPVCYTSRIGLIWVAEGQTKEEEFLANAHSAAPPRYIRFLSGLGQLLRLRGLPPDVFTGGLDYASDADGAYALFTRDAGSQAVFHVATLMPPGRLADKKRHIGNDLVAIFYLERNPPVPETVAQADFDPEVRHHVSFSNDVSPYTPVVSP